MDNELKKTLERNHIYNTAPKCPFCGGTMLPLSYLVDIEGYKSPYAWCYDDVPGRLKACDNRIWIHTLCPKKHTMVFVLGQVGPDFKPDFRFWLDFEDGTKE